MTFSKDARSGWKTFFMLYGNKYNLMLKLSMKLPFPNSKDL